MALPRPAELVHLGEAWTQDVATARSELEATGSQAFVLAAHAFAWRIAVATLSTALAVTGFLVLEGVAAPGALLIAAVLGGLGPQMVAFLVTFPVDWFATLETWFRGSRDARLRFGVTGLVYPYYGWRYAFRGRVRPWGALTHSERVALNPKRAGVNTGPAPRRDYWPQ